MKGEVLIAEYYDEATQTEMVKISAVVRDVNRTIQIDIPLSPLEIVDELRQVVDILKAWGATDIHASEKVKEHV